MTPIAVAVVEDHPDLRKGLSLILAATPGYSCAGSYERCEDLLPALPGMDVHAILMDIGLPGMSGIEGIRKVKADRPDIKILVQTIYEDDQHVFDAICAGADGYVLKKAPPLELLQAIRQTVEGGVPMSGSIARQVIEMFKGLAPDQEQEHLRLTAREREILRTLADGLDYKQIAERHFISIDTVRNHIRHIYDKLHVHSKSEAVAKAFRQRLV
jgi:DNA-binding NarL/FixJ family response regulator